MVAFTHTVHAVKLEFDRRDVFVVATHWSYMRQTQCHNALDTRALLIDPIFQATEAHRAKLPILLVLGDFNTYVDYEHPIAVLGVDVAGGVGDCLQRLNLPTHALSSGAAGSVPLSDAWRATHTADAGLTFSTLPFVVRWLSTWC